MLPELKYPAAYYDGHACLYRRSARFSSSHLGGPPRSAFRFSGKSFGTRRIHHVMTLGWKLVPGIENRGFSELPLFYGMRYGGCSMKYEILPPEVDLSAIDLTSKGERPDLSSECHILEMKPLQSSEDWPYVGYPDLLPYVPLALVEQIPCSPEDFQDLLVDGDPVSPEEVTVVVPPMYDLGMSLFGPDADGEGLQLVFRCSVQNKKLTIRV